jgi:uncharacterized membrane protein
MLIPDMPENASPSPLTPKGHGLMYRLRNYFLTGLIVLGPVALTIAIISWVVTTVDEWVKPFIPTALWPEQYVDAHIPGIGLVVALFGLTLLGFLTANIMGRSLLRYGEGLVARTPVVRGLYRAFKQVFEMVFSSSSTSFRKAGLVEFPQGCWSVVLISTAPIAALAEKMSASEEMVSVFLPCAPNPTTGFYFYVPKSKVRELDITPDEAFKLVMSVGMIQPGQQPKPE